VKIVVALDSFKGGLSAEAACRAVAEGLRAARPEIAVVCTPMADGGEGTATALLAARPGGAWIAQSASGPLPGQQVQAGYAWFAKDRVAVVEMAAASGLPLLAEHERNPLKTTTRGTGELIRAAGERGAQRILLAIGGSATNDGGIGAAAALGWRFLDANGQEVEPVGGRLGAITRIIPPERAAWPPMTVLCDVTNPLCGPRGAASVYGPQKGATPEMVAQLDDGLRNLAARIRADLGRDVLELAGGGAAGGLGAGAVAFFNAELAPGIETIIHESGLRNALRGADWCITGEGAFDAQSLDGKVVSGVAAAARKCGARVVVFAGQVRVAAATYRRHGIAEAVALQPPGMPLAEAIQRTAELLRDAARQWIRAESVNNERTGRTRMKRPIRSNPSTSDVESEGKPR